MARRSKEEAEQTRRSLLDTALTLFSEKGTANVTLAQIASAAGVTRGAIYWHFKDKAEMIDTLSDEIFEPLTKKYEALYAKNEADPLATLQALGVDVFQQVASDPRFKMMCGVLQQANFDPQMQEKSLKHAYEEMEGMRSLMTRAKEVGVLRHDLLPESAALIIRGFLQGVIGRWLMNENILDLAAESQSMMAVIIDGLRAR